MSCVSRGGGVGTLSGYAIRPEAESSSLGVLGCIPTSAGHMPPDWAAVRSACSKR